MKNYKKILSFTLALIMALSVSAVSITAGAAGSANGTVVLNENFETGSPTDGTSIYDYNQSAWTQTLNGHTDGTANSVNTIKDVSGNKVASLERTVMDIADTSKGYTSYSMETNLKALDAETKLVNIDFRLRATNENTNGLEVEIFDSTKSDTVYFFMKKNHVWGDYDGNIRDKSVSYNTVGEWNDIKIVMDYTTGEEKIYVNGVLCIDHETENTTKDKFANGITGLPVAIGFGTPRIAGDKGGQKDATSSAEFQIDDVVVTGYTAADLAAMAEQEVDAALAKLSDVTAITTAENLTLPTAADLGTTATVTWKSSNPSVIADNGEVIKANSEQTAQLTATISSGSVTKTKVFDVTVLPANVYFYEGFNSVLKSENMPILGYNNWGVNADATATNDNEITIKKEAGTNNFYGSIIHKGEKAGPQYYGIEKSVSTTAGTGKIFSFRLMRGDITTQRLHVYLFARDTQLVTMYVNTAYSSIEMKSHNSKMLYYPTSKRAEGNWMDFDVVIDETNKNFKIYVDGELATTDVEGKIPMTALSVDGVISKIRFIPDRLNATTTAASSSAAAGETADFRIDDIMISEASQDMLSCIAARDSLSFGNPVVNDLDITDEVNGTTITLNSSNTSVIANNGKVTRPDTEELTPVTLTVTITKGSESITQTYDVNVAPKYLTKITGIYVSEETSVLDTIKLTNFAKLEKAVAFAAVYTKNSEGAYVLKGVQKADDITNILAKGSQEIGFSENKLTVGTGDEIRVFFWNDTNSLTPIARAYTYTYSAEDAE